MRKFLLNSLLFTLFLMVAYTVAIFLCGTFAPLSFTPNLNYKRGDYGHTYTRLAEVKKTTNVDILFLGASNAYRGFDPRIFSKKKIKVFNLGSSSQTPIQTNILLKRYLKNLNPKVVVYAINPIILRLDGVESSLDIIANDKNDIDSYRMAFKLNHIKTYNTLLYAMTKRLLNLEQPLKEPIIKDKDTYISGGYVEKQSDGYNPTLVKVGHGDINQEQLEVFSELITDLKSKNIRVVLVYTPLAPSLYSTSYFNSTHFDSIMKSHSEYYNFNELLNLEESLHFFDAYHLNKNGVSLFNDKLIEILNEQ